MTTNPDGLKEAYRRTAVIGVAMMSTLVMYLVVALVVESTNDPFEGFAGLEDGGLLRNLFLGLSLLQIVAIKIIRSRALYTPHQPVPYQEATPARQSQLRSRLVALSIVTFALAESIAVFGLVLFLLNGEATDFYVFLGLSLLTFIMFFPQYHQWEAWLQKQPMV